MRRTWLGLAQPLLILALPLAGCTAQTDSRLGQSEPTSTSSQATSVCGQTSVQGVDVSHYDGTIDWTQAKAAGISFAFVKASEGTTFVDPMFATNWAGMKAAGIVRGAYHFFDAGTDPTQQAAFFLQTVGTLEPGDLPPVLDFEQAGSTLADATTFLAAVTQMTGRTGIIYTSPSFLSDYSGLGNYGLWVANWGVSCPDVPAPWSTYAFWQTSSTGTVAGISSMVDLDVFNGTVAQLGGSSSGGSSSSSGGSGGSSGGGGGSSGGTSGSSGSGSSSGGGSDGTASSGSGSGGGAGATSNGGSGGSVGATGSSSGGSGIAPSGEAGSASFDLPASQGGCSMGTSGSGGSIPLVGLAMLAALRLRRRRKAGSRDCDERDARQGSSKAPPPRFHWGTARADHQAQPRARRRAASGCRPRP